MTTTTHQSDLIGRTAERTALAAFVTHDDERLALVIEGEAGIGKSELWLEGVRLAHAAGRRVLACAPSAAEQGLSFAALGDLLVGVTDAELDRLTPSQRAALDVALGRIPPQGTPPDARILGHAVLGLLRGGDGGRPLVAIDGLDDVDDASATALRFALSRVEVRDVRVLATRRGDGSSALPLGLDRVGRSAATRLTVGPLSLGELHAVLQRRAATSFSRPVLRRLHEATGGNPSFAIEAARALRASGRTPRPDEPLPVPEDLRALIDERVGGLPGDVVALLEHVTLLADRRLATVTALADHLGVEGAVDAAVRLGVLQVAGDHVGLPRLLAAGIDARIGPERRRAVHAGLAEVTAVDDEEHALHVALATTVANDAVADAVDGAADRAAARGAVTVAGRLKEHAARLTPSHRRDAAQARLLAAADLAVTAGDLAHGRELLGALIGAAEPGPLRARALSLLSWANLDACDLRLAETLSRQALAEVGDDPFRGTIRLRSAIIEEISGDLGTAAEHLRGAVEDATAAGDQGQLALALAQAGYLATLRGHGVTDESWRAVAIERELGAHLGFYTPSVCLGQVLMYTGAWEQARAVLEQALVRAGAAGEEEARASVLFHLADLDRRVGQWTRARTTALRVETLYDQIGNEQERSAGRIVGVLLAIAMDGDDGAGVERARLGLEVAERIGDDTFAVHYRGALGFAALSAGDAQGALGWLSSATDELLARGVGELSIYPVVQHEVEALGATGDTDRLARLAGHLEHLGEPLPRPWNVAIAARARGLVAAAEGDLDGARLALERAAAIHIDLGDPFELARVETWLGTIERRAKRKRSARDLLERAAGRFAALPAPRWEAKARSELERLGQRADPGALTETEARIAALAAAGRTNPEIAATVFVSRKTVEANLTSIYRKLGVRSRVELARHDFGDG